MSIYLRYGDSTEGSHDAKNYGLTRFKYLQWAVHKSVVSNKLPYSTPYFNCVGFESALVDGN